jgi:hypothetical protein
MVWKEELLHFLVVGASYGVCECYAVAWDLMLLCEKGHERRWVRSNKSVISYCQHKTYRWLVIIPTGETSVRCGRIASRLQHIDKEPLQTRFHLHFLLYRNSRSSGLMKRLCRGHIGNYLIQPIYVTEHGWIALPFTLKATYGILLWYLESHSNNGQAISNKGCTKCRWLKKLSNCDTWTTLPQSNSMLWALIGPIDRFFVDIARLFFIHQPRCFDCFQQQAGKQLATLEKRIENVRCEPFVV